MPGTLLAPIFCLIFFWLDFSVSMPAAADGSQVFEQIFERDENRYHFKYVTHDLQQREEFGELVTKGDQQILVVKGYYSYLNHGRINRVNYRADENGYRATVTSQIAVTGKRIGSNLIASLAGGGLG